MNDMQAVDPKITLTELEEKTLEYWKKNEIFEKSVSSRPEDKTWTFLDGPPFVTGLPHYGHLLTSIAKDLFPRFWTMKGYRVRRVWGWDGHGLPIENKVENKLEIKRKKDIEDVVGVDKFIEECKKYVNEVSGEWEWYVDHIGRWVDFKHAYKTWDLPYMESVMWVFKQMYEKELVYKGLRVSLYCPHCATPISNFEVAMDNSYKEVPDAATTYKYQLEEDPKTFVLAWSTTPWNKIVTPALAVNPEMEYVKVEQNGEQYILAKSTIKILGDEGSYKVLDTFKGTDLIGKKYIPHYDYYKDKIQAGEKAFEVIPGDFVTADEGTGVVTIAVYGEEDLKVMREQNVHMEMHVDEEGHILSSVPMFGGMYYLKANKAVNDDLASRNLIYKDEEVAHNVPVCWRCSTRLYYAPLNAWFVNVQGLKGEMKKTNEKVNWYPEHFKHGRFEKSLENAPDWNISRNRYWGSPIPVWECEKCGERFVPGSIKELEDASGVKITDLHKPEIDTVTVTCKKCGEKVHRVPEVLDSWIEAGSASFGERHYPFGEQPPIESFYPPDFIVEYTGQIRAWFYVLHVISNALFQREAFKNVMVTGVILGTDGKKMSKSLGNFPDPKGLIQKFGGDALRLYLMGSPVIKGEDLIISEENYRNQVRGMLLILWNSYNFFVSYALVDGWTPKEASQYKSQNTLDKWILSKLSNLNKNETEALEKYDPVAVVELVQKFVTDFSTWYIRRSRDRVGPTATDEQDKEAFYETCYVVLTTLCKLLAPLTPFITEEMYRNLTGSESVHLEYWPKFDESQVDDALEDQMALARQVVEAGLSFRKTNSLKLKTPLKTIELQLEGDFTSIPEGVWQVVLDELNTKNILINGTVRFPKTEVEVTDEMLQKEGEARDIVRKIQAERKTLGTTLDEKVNVTLDSWPKEFEDEIKRKALIDTLETGEFKVARLS